jgi:hypothetical protein
MRACLATCGTAMALGWATPIPLAVATDEPCSDQVISKMVSNAIEGAQLGRCDAEGNFVIAIASIEGDSRQAFEQARMEALRAIAEQFGLKVAGDTVSKDESRSTGSNVEFSSYFSTQTSTSVRETLAGVASKGVIDAGSRRVAVFSLTERSIERQDDLRRAVARRSDGPATVVATGVAMVRESRVDMAAKGALDSAKRQAVEMVMGAMLIGQSKTSMTDADTQARFGSYVFGNTAGFIDSFRVLEERQDPPVYLVRIEATVTPKKLFDSYREHLQSIGDPLFAVDANGDERLEAALLEFFKAKGLRLAASTQGADYLIDAKAKYTVVNDPGDVTGGTKGIRGEIAWSIANARTREPLSNLRTDGRSTSFVGSDPERQKDLVIESIMRKKGPELHQKLQDFVAQLVAGRPLRVRFERCTDLVDGDVRERLLALLRLHPQVRDIKPMWNAPDLDLEVTVVGRADQLAGDVVRLMAEAGAKTPVRAVSETPSEIRFASP